MDVHVFLNELPSWFTESLRDSEEIVYISPGRETNGNPGVCFLRGPDGSYFRIVYGDGAEFLVNRTGSEIWSIWTGNLTIKDSFVYLFGPIVGFVLRIRGLISLHASAVSIDSRAVAIVGSAGAGKSTTAASFALLGYPVLSDDVLPLLDHGDFFSVQSGYPCVCLWPESVESLYGSSDSLPRLTPTWDKRYLALGKDGHRFQRDPMPLAAIYVLGNRETQPGRPFAEPVTGADALLPLVCNTYMNYLLDSAGQAREFELLGRIAGAVPIRKVQPHSDPAYLNKLCEVIVADFRSLKSPEKGSGATRVNQIA